MKNGEDRVSGLLRGAVGSVAGLAAMGLYFKAASALSNGGDEAGGDMEEGNGASSREAGAENGESRDPIERHHELDDISLVGDHSREDEPATASVGRIAYETATGDEPDEELKQRLGQAVHWGYGILLGGLYGALRTRAEEPDLVGGLGYGTAAWVIGDELMVPMLGLAEGPTAHPWTDHAKALGAHLVYGAATSTATQALKRVM